jgi:hypothetical protein
MFSYLYTSWFFVVFSAIAFSILAWILTRLVRKKLWFPILGELYKKDRVMPKFYFKMPSLIPFFIFLLLSLCMLFLSFGPVSLLQKTKIVKEKKLLLFFDLSASVSYSQSLNTYLQKADLLLTTLPPHTKIYYATSHDGKIKSYIDKSTTIEDLKALSFHKQGVDLGAVFQTLFTKIDDIRYFIIAADKDAYSWKDIRPNKDTKNSKLYFFDMGVDLLDKQNIWIDSFEQKESLEDLVIEWDVDLLRSSDQGVKKGVLAAYFGENKIKEYPWTIEAGKKRKLMRLKFSKQDLFKNSKTSHPAYIKWVLEDIDDGILLDNKYYTSYNLNSFPVVIAASSEGEYRIHDPTYDLQVSFNTLGFPVTRMGAELQGYEDKKYNLFVMSINGQKRDLKLCQDVKAIEGISNLWISNTHLEEDFQLLCKCLAVLDDREASLCEQMDIQDFKISMTNNGYSKIGENEDDPNYFIAWFKEKHQQRRSVTVFNMALRASVARGMSHGRFPLFIRDMLVMQKLLKKDDFFIQNKILRIADISKTWQQQQKSLELMNVPSYESQVNFLSASSLPKLWSRKVADKVTSNESTYEKNPLFYIRLIALLSIILILLEAIYFLIRRKISKSALGASSLFCLLLLLPWDLKAIQLVDFSDIKAESFSRLSMEVANRTSISLESIRKFDVQGDDLFKSPWLWVRKTEADLLAQKDFMDELSVWLKKGGFLILDNSAEEWGYIEVRKKILNSLRGSFVEEVDSDSELMKSFYLFKKLPQCNGNPWSVIKYDNRISVLFIPFALLSSVANDAKTDVCVQDSKEILYRYFVNVILVSLTTDYKKDQIHINKILERLN